jgi:primosomal protein N' (replication factor Y) (superfamily II helicase)
MNYWDVAVEAPLSRLFTYATDQSLQAGQSVDVPFGKRKIKAVLVAPSPQTIFTYEVKNIIGLDEERPPLSKALLDWALWVARYYHYPPGEVFSLFFPSLKKKGRSEPKDLFDIPSQKKDLILTNDQQKVIADFKTAAPATTHLLWGVTGSGKTEVYIELIREKLRLGQGAIVLVPEISLTPQLVTRFRSNLGNSVAVLHSDLTERERTNQWWSVINKEKRVLIGARSALFCPMPDLGIIVVDEEHEASFKQDEHLRYHARDAAIMRGHFENCQVLLGSATPSLESWKNAQENKYILHRLKERPSSGLMPDIEVVDISEREAPEMRHSSLPFWLSTRLYNLLEENYTKGLQSALFLNRRGVAQQALCQSCGFIYMCPNCEISLTLHGRSSLVCHYCQYAEEMKHECPTCHVGVIKPLGLGTEQVEEDLKKLFPLARTARVDRDEIDSRESLENFIDNMEKGEIDILVGTQMIAKGLDFENLTLVGLVLADIAFNIPDFRSAERSYQLITQVSGRSGRHHKGHVVIQTYRPDHPGVTFAQAYDTAGFLNQELVHRQELDYPPYTRMASLRISSLNRNDVEEGADRVGAELRAYCQKNKWEDVRILGPAPAPLVKIRNRFRHQILIKSKSLSNLHNIVQFVEHLESKFKRIKIQIDVDPYNLM